MRAAAVVAGARRVTIGATPTIPPSANVLDWWKAGDIALANAAAIPTWAPRVGSTSLVQATGTNQPTYRTGVLNGKPAVRFDGSNDFLSGTLGASDSQPLTVYILFKATVVNNAAREILHAGSVELQLAALTTTTATRATWTNAARTFGVYTQNTWELWSMVFNGGTSEYYVNGTLVGVTGSVGNGIFGPLLVLGKHNTAGQNLNGDVTDLVHCDGAHDATQRTAVHTYFRDEYGLTIAGV